MHVLDEHVEILDDNDVSNISVAKNLNGVSNINATCVDSGSSSRSENDADNDDDDDDDDVDDDDDEDVDDDDDDDEDAVGKKASKKMYVLNS